MNREFERAMKEPSIHFTVKRWWKCNGYEFLRVVLFPFWLATLLYSKYQNWANARCAWNEERTREILSYYIPKTADWDEKNKTFYFFDNGSGWGNNMKFIKHKDRRYWKKYCGWFGEDIRRYLIDIFETEGFIKEIGCCDDGWTSVNFILK